MKATKIIKAGVKVNGKSIGWFYCKNETETQNDLYKRIIDVIFCIDVVCESLVIDWEN